MEPGEDEKALGTGQIIGAVLLCLSAAIVLVVLIKKRSGDSQRQSKSGDDPTSDVVGEEGEEEGDGEGKVGEAGSGKKQQRKTSFGSNGFRMATRGGEF